MTANRWLARDDKTRPRGMPPGLAVIRRREPRAGRLERAQILHHVTDLAPAQHTAHGRHARRAVHARGDVGLRYALIAAGVHDDVGRRLFLERAEQLLSILQRELHRAETGCD